MKKIVGILTLIVIIISLATISMAAEVSMSLSPDADKVQLGNEVKVRFLAKDFTREGTEKAIEAKIEFDSEKLEYKSVNWNNGWTGNFSTDGTGMVAQKSSQVTANEVVVEIVYKVKDNATLGSTIIKASDILTSADGDEVEVASCQTSIEIKEKEQPQQVTLSSIQIKNAPSKTKYTEGESFNSSGLKIIAKYSDGTVKEVTDYKCSPSGTLKTSDTKIVITYTENGVTKSVEQKIEVVKKQGNNAGEQNNTNVNKVTGGDKKDNTLADKVIPPAGAKTIIIPSIIIVAIIIVSYIGYKRYKGI